MRRSLCVAAAIAAVLVPLRPAAAVEERLILQPAEGTIIRIEGHYEQRENVCPFKQRKPLLARYRGRLELRSGSDGEIQIVNALSFSHYLRGLAEVPTSWPLETLRAQVIAARSYAFATMRDEAASARARGYDICATDQCQVYRGATVELGAFGDRWVDAVESTRGKVMTYNGAPIKAFYFSTSTGTTRKSFFSRTEGPAWLDHVDAMDDDAPLARWTAPVRLRDLEAVLRADGLWPAGRITSVRQRGDDIVVAGGGRRATLSRSSVRGSLNSEGPCLFPERYPSQTGSQTDGPLPQTVPSSTYSLRQDGNRVVIRGRGWGHDVGMSQYGARALGDRGWKAPRILDHFYNHERLSTVKEPSAIRVLAAAGLQRVRILIEGTATVTSGTGSELAPGTEFEVRSPGGRFRVFRGRGPTLRSVTTVTAAPATLEGEPGATVTLPFELSRSARANVELVDAGGEVVFRTRERSYVSGEHEVELRLRADDGTSLAPGDYQATVVANDGLDVIRSEPVAVGVRSADRPPAVPGDDGTAAGSSGVPVIPIAVAALALAVAAFLVLRARRATRA